MSNPLLELTGKVDFEMGRRDFKYFFEDICGFQLADFHNEWYEMSQKNTRLALLHLVIMANLYSIVSIYYGKWHTTMAQKSYSFHTVSISPLNTWAKMNELIETTPAFNT